MRNHKGFFVSILALLISLALSVQSFAQAAPSPADGVYSTWKSMMASLTPMGNNEANQGLSLIFAKEQICFDALSRLKTTIRVNQTSPTGCDLSTHTETNPCVSIQATPQEIATSLWPYMLNDWKLLVACKEISETADLLIIRGLGHGIDGAKE